MPIEHRTESSEPKASREEPKKTLSGVAPHSLDPFGASSPLVPLDDIVAYHNQRDPNITIVHEKPEHRTIAYAKACGMSNRELCEQFGYTDAWMSQLVRQPWFTSIVNQMQKRAGQDAVTSAIKENAMAAVETVVELMHSAESEPVRASCAFDVINRYLGKPTQRVETKSEVVATYEDVTGIDKDLLRVNAELKQMGAA